MPHNFWMINCNEENYNVTRRMGFIGQGLKAEYRRKVQRVEPGDRVIYYVTGSRVFTATATVTQGYEEIGSSPWIKEGKATWPYRIGIKPDVILRDDQFISAGLIAYRLEYVRKWAPGRLVYGVPGELAPAVQERLLPARRRNAETPRRPRKGAGTDRRRIGGRRREGQLAA